MVDVADLNGIIQSSSAAAERLFGYSPSELIGESVRILIPTNRQSEEDAVLARIRRGERVDHFETVRVTKDGRPVSDIRLPEIDGCQLMEEVRRKPPMDGGAIPAVTLTAFARSEDRTWAMLGGYQAHLAKPIESTELIATIASFIDVVNLRRSTADPA